MSEYAILRREEAPDYNDAPGAFLGYGRPLGAEQVALKRRSNVLRFAVTVALGAAGL